MKMKKNPLLSIIIPVYNEEKVIRQCLESLLMQSYQHKEIIVVDDGSTDKTLEVLSQIKIKDYAVEDVSRSKFKMLKQDHKGPAQARNLGAAEARGEILIFVDSDMTFEKNFLRNLVKPIIDGREKGTFSKEEYIGNWEHVLSRCWNYNRNFSLKKMHNENIGDEGTDFRAILKNEFERVGGFSDGGYTDSWTLFQKLGYRPKVAKNAIFYHNNPESFSEIFIQSKWMSKRPYKLGILGDLIALIRYSVLFSLVIGIYKAIKNKTWQFLPFKIVFDFGGFVGILEKVFFGKLAK